MAQQYQITIDTEQVVAIAAQLEKENKSLKDTLDLTKATIDSLDAVWTGPAADATRQAYTDFANKFFQKYYDVIDQYVKFLRKNVAEHYDTKEAQNVSLGNSFK